MRSPSQKLVPASPSRAHRFLFGNRNKNDKDGRRLGMCAGAGDTLSVGAQSALADMRGPGVRLPRAGWGSRRTSARCSLYYV